MGSSKVLVSDHWKHQAHDSDVWHELQLFDHMSLKQSLKRHPRIKKAAQILRGDQILVLNYPVNLKPRYGGLPHRQLYDLISSGSAGYRATLRSFLEYKDQLSKLKNVSWRNGYFSALDSVSLYCLLAQQNPGTYFEIGSGNSTIFARQSVINNGLRTRIVSLDPNPRINVDDFCDDVIRTPVEEVALSVFEELSQGDVLFVDNSHRCLPNSDVTVFFMDILPQLKPGVLVHLHDICLPWDYPQEIALDAYSEQYVFATALLMGNKLRTLLPNQFISRTPDLVSILNPIFDALGNIGREGCSYWISIENNLTSTAQPRYPTNIGEPQ